jgi:hypothetical protein
LCSGTRKNWWLTAFFRNSFTGAELNETGPMTPTSVSPSSGAEKGNMAADERGLTLIRPTQVHCFQSVFIGVDPWPTRFVRFSASC